MCLPYARIAGSVNIVIRNIITTKAAKTVPINAGITNFSAATRSNSLSVSLAASFRMKWLILSPLRNPVIDIICTRTNATVIYHPTF